MPTACIIGCFTQRHQPHWFLGCIDDVRIYNRALSATDVSNLYNGTTATLGSNLNVDGTLTVNTISTLACGNYAITTAGDVTNSGAMTIGGSGTWTCNGSTNFTGNAIPFQALTVNASHSATLSVSSTVAGATAVNGTLTVASGVTLTNTGGLTVGAAGTLAGTGTVSGAITTVSGAAISPAGAGAEGTLTLSGTTPLSGAVATTNLAIDVNAGATDLLTFSAASGSVALGNIALALTTTSPSGAYTILSYPSGSVSGTFASVSGMPANYEVGLPGEQRRVGAHHALLGAEGRATGAARATGLTAQAERAGRQCRAVVTTFILTAAPAVARVPWT